MPHLATMGTSSCATMAIGWFKGARQENEAYKADKDTYEEEEGLTVMEFRDEVLNPISQPLGRTANMPFEKLMEDIEDTDLSGKMCIITLNRDQFLEGYWPEELNRWDFFLVTKCKNNWG